MLYFCTMYIEKRSLQHLKNWPVKAGQFAKRIYFSKTIRYLFGWGLAGVVIFRWFCGWLCTGFLHLLCDRRVACWCLDLWGTHFLVSRMQWCLCIFNFLCLSRFNTAIWKKTQELFILMFNAQMFIIVVLVYSFYFGQHSFKIKRKKSIFIHSFWLRDNIAFTLLKSKYAHEKASTLHTTFFAWLWALSFLIRRFRSNSIKSSPIWVLIGT